MSQIVQNSPGCLGGKTKVLSATGGGCFNLLLWWSTQQGRKREGPAGGLGTSDDSYSGHPDPKEYLLLAMNAQQVLYFNWETETDLKYPSAGWLLRCFQKPGLDLVKAVNPGLSYRQQGFNTASQGTAAASSSKPLPLCLLPAVPSLWPCVSSRLET